MKAFAMLLMINTVFSAPINSDGNQYFLLAGKIDFFYIPLNVELL